MKPDHFYILCDKFGAPHLWGKDSIGNWRLRHNAVGNGFND